LSAAEIVAPNGSVIGIDLAPGMIEVARSRAANRGLKNVEFQEADAESLPFEDRSFDAVLCHYATGLNLTYPLKIKKEDQRILFSVNQP
jgi:ubiquinone/menaquinone biosynthesis C-methylase UbiE